MLKEKGKGIPQQSRGWDCLLPLLGAQVQSPVRELKMPQAKNKGCVGQTQTVKEVVTSILDKVKKH